MNLRISIGCYILYLYFAIFGRSFDLPRNSIYVIDRNNNSNSARREWVPDHRESPEEIFITLQQSDAILQALALTGEHDDKPSKNHVLFYLYTKKKPIDGQELKIDSRESVRDSYFQGNNPTVFITHGYFINANFAPVTSIRDQYLNAPEEINVIAVDWSSLSISRYDMAVKNVVTAGIKIARMIDFLRTYANLKLCSTTLVGHSLGAHVMGAAGLRVTGGKVNRLFGLDPAFSYFRDKKSPGRLSRRSARNVQVIHTNGNRLGLLEPLGHTDFYVNGGTSQPGCVVLDGLLAESCSHGRAFWLFAESINSRIGFKGLKCRRRDNRYTGPCRGRVGMMGGRSKRSPPVGIYFIKTSDTPPFALPMRWIRN